MSDAPLVPDTVLPPVRCAVATAEAGEALDGTAPSAVGWLALEQPGPWGAKAWKASALDPELGSRLESLASDAGLRAVLVRRPGRTGPGPLRHTVLVGHDGLDGAVGAPVAGAWLLRGEVDDPAEVLALDVAAVARGDLAAVRASLPALEPEAEPHLLVCANGKRDACCAVFGRPVAAAAALAHPGRVWETTHLGGHRFAPTAVVLPSGWCHGRLDLAGAEQVLAGAADGTVDLATARGRSRWPVGGQVAELAVRRAAGLTGVDDVVDVRREDDVAWVVTGDGGRRWRVVVRKAVRDGVVRPESCVKPAKPLVELVADAVEEIAAG